MDCSFNAVKSRRERTKLFFSHIALYSKSAYQTTLIYSEGRAFTTTVSLLEATSQKVTEMKTDSNASGLMRMKSSKVRTQKDEIAKVTIYLGVPQKELERSGSSSKITYRKAMKVELKGKKQGKMNKRKTSEKQFTAVSPEYRRVKSANTHKPLPLPKAESRNNKNVNETVVKLQEAFEEFKMKYCDLKEKGNISHKKVVDIHRQYIAKNKEKSFSSLCVLRMIFTAWKAVQADLK